LIATCSAGVARHIISRGAPADKVRVVLNGIDLHRFDDVPSKTESRHLLQLPADAPIVGCVAHLSAKKGQEYLLKAVALLKEKFPDLQCLLVGEGVMREDLTRMADLLGIGDRVHLLGYREDVVSVMNSMDIVVLPSIAKEGLGLVLVEAALLKIPTIGSNAPGIDEAVQDGVSGFLVPPGNTENLAEKIVELLENPLLRKLMGEAGMKRAHNMFSLETMTDSTEAIYREMITGKH
jgi:glycosyltransferase involved in cell wall biosynthesis